MENLIAILFLGMVLYVLFKISKGTQETAVSQVTPSKIFTNNIPEDALERNLNGLREMFVNGDMANQMTTDLILKKGEHLIFDIPGVSLCEERTVKTKGTTRSVRVRVMKGVSVGLGGFEASPETEVVPIDHGNITLTNQRIHFAGTTKTVDYSLSKINTIEKLDNGFAISRAGKTKIEYYLGTDNMSLLVTVTPEENEDFEPEQISYVLNGEQCKGILLEAISRID